MKAAILLSTLLIMKSWLRYASIFVRESTWRLTHESVGRDLKGNSARSRIYLQI